MRSAPIQAVTGVHNSLSQGRGDDQAYITALKVLPGEEKWWCKQLEMNFILAMCLTANRFRQR